MWLGAEKLLQFGHETEFYSAEYNCFNYPAMSIGLPPFSKTAHCHGSDSASQSKATIIV